VSSVSDEQDFVQTVAAIVIQTASRRMLAMNLAERMLLEMSASEKTQQGEDDSSGQEHRPEIAFSGSEHRLGAFPFEGTHCYETSSSTSAQGHEAPPLESDCRAGPEYVYGQCLVAFPSEAAFPTEAEQPLEVSRPKNECHLETFSSKFEQYLAAFPTENKPEPTKHDKSAPLKFERDFAAFSAVNEQSHESMSPDGAHQLESPPVKHEHDLVAFPSVKQRVENLTAETAQPQPQKNIPAKQERDFATFPSMDALQRETAKQEFDLEILPSLGARHLKTSQSDDGVHLEAVPYHMYDIAAIQIQSLFRGWWVRDSLNVDHFCACRIQRAYRSFRERMSFVFDIYRIAIVQSLWRRKLAQRKAEKLRMENLYRDAMPTSPLPVREEVVKETHRMHAGDDASGDDASGDDASGDDASGDDSAATSIQLTERDAEKPRTESPPRDEMPSSPPAVRQEVKEDSLRIHAVDDAAATKIQSQCRGYMARKEFLEGLMGVLLVQSIARRWLAKNLVSSRIREKARDQAKHTREVHQFSPIRPDTVETQESEESSLEEPVPAETPERQAESPKDTLETPAGQTDYSEESEEEMIDNRGGIHRVPSEASEGEAVIHDEDGQQWVKVSHSYDEDTFVQSYASRAVSLDSKEKTEVTKLSADEVIELFIHMSTNSDSSARDITPLRMESPVDCSQNARGAGSVTSSQGLGAGSVASSQGTPKGQEGRGAGSVASLQGKAKVDGRPPRKEKSEEPIVDKDVLIAKEKVDRMNARLSASAAMLWGS